MSMAPSHLSAAPFTSPSNTIFLPRREPFSFNTAALDNIYKRWRQKDVQLEESLKPKLPPLPKSLPPSDEATVQRLLEKRGPIAKFARETVEDKDIARLRPGQWLNDEIINFYGAMILARSEGSKENVPQVNGKVAGGAMKRRGAPLNIHYFSSFFWAKLTGDGYDKGRLAKWTKKVCMSILGMSFGVNHSYLDGHFHKGCHSDPCESQQCTLDGWCYQFPSETHRIL